MPDNANKKIAFITYALNYGGVSSYISDLANVFEKKGYQIDIITTEKKGEYFNVLKRKGRSLVNISFGIFRWIPLGRIIHSIITGIIIRKKGYNAVFISHSYAAQSSLFLYYRNTLTFSVIHNIEKNVVRLGCSNCNYLDSIICVSNNIYKKASVIAGEAKCVVIENGIFIPDDIEYYNRSGFEVPLRIVYVGRMDNWQKGIFCLPAIIKACTKNHEEIRLSIAGSGEDEDKLKEMFKKNKQENIINFLGTLPREEIMKLYSRHHILIMPSRFEGLPLTLMEAMSWGCVPVVSNLIGITDYCVDNEKNGFLVEVGDIGGYADKIRHIYKTKELWQTMSSAARDKAKKEFSIGKMAEKYMSLIYQFNGQRDMVCFHFLSMLELYTLEEIVPNGIIMGCKRLIRKSHKEITIR